MSRLVSRGLGRGVAGNVGFISFGAGRPIMQEIARLVKLGQSGTKRALKELQEVVVGVRLIRVNDAPVDKKVQGHVTVRFNAAAQTAISAAKLVASRVRSVLEDVKITIKRIR